MCICVYVRLYSLHTCAYIQAHMHKRTQTCGLVRSCIYIPTQAHTHTHTYMHKHISTVRVWIMYAVACSISIPFTFLVDETNMITGKIYMYEYKCICMQTGLISWYLLISSHLIVSYLNCILLSHHITSHRIASHLVIFPSFPLHLSISSFFSPLSSSCLPLFILLTPTW